MTLHTCSLVLMLSSLTLGVSCTKACESHISTIRSSPLSVTFLMMSSSSCIQVISLMVPKSTFTMLAEMRLMRILRAVICRRIHVYKMDYAFGPNMDSFTVMRVQVSSLAFASQTTITLINQSLIKGIDVFICT